MESNVINYSLTSLDFIRALVFKMLPDAKINDITPFQCSSPNALNPFNAPNNSDKNYLYYGFFIGDSNINLIIPNNSAVLTIGVGTSAAPILFFNVDQATVTGNWVFVGYQIDISTGVINMNVNAPSVVQPFNGTISPVIAFLSNDANNDIGGPSLGVKCVFGSGADHMRIYNIQTGLEYSSSSGDYQYGGLPLKGVLSIQAKRNLDSALAEKIDYNIYGDISPYTYKGTKITDAGGGNQRTSFQFLSSQLFKFVLLELRLSDNTLVGSVPVPTINYNSGGTSGITLYVQHLASLNLYNAYWLAKPSILGFDCVFSFKHLITGLGYAAP